MTTLSTSKLIFGPELAGISLTPEEFDAIDEADQKYRYELINKRLIVTLRPWKRNVMATRSWGSCFGFIATMIPKARRSTIPCPNKRSSL